MIGGTFTVVFAALTCAILIVALYPWLERYALARPNARSSHRAPTPQGAGIAVLAAVIAAVGVALLFDLLGSSANAAPFSVMGAAVLMACIGAVDDIRPLPVGPRLLLQALAVAWVIYALPDQWRLVPLLPLSIERALVLIGGLWFVNLVNFMDGIDWMTVVEVLPLSAGLAAAGEADALPPSGTVVALALGGAMIGFAHFNRPVAKIFLGDVGSLPIGLILGWLLLLLAAGGHLIAALLMPLYYLADSTVTLMQRVVRGEPVWQAHRTHFYQVATDRGFTVSEVVARVFIVNVVLCALAFLTVVTPSRINDIAALSGGAAVVTLLLAAFARGKK